MIWKPEYSMGIQEIDDQHKALIKEFSLVDKLVSTGQGWSKMHYAVVELGQIARRHFDFEEALMRLFGFSGAVEHQKAHQHFFQRLDEFEHHSLRDSAEKKWSYFYTSGCRITF